MRRIRSCILASLFVCLMFAAAGLAPEDVQGQALQKTRLGIPTINILTRPIYIAKDKGFFAAKGSTRKSSTCRAPWSPRLS